jgi:KUP system potassium uptake protein
MVISRTAAGEQVQNPFFELVPSLLQYPLIALATLAAVIASQALISGAYSLTHQAIRLGFLPRIPVIHTSETTEGQIYVPKVNFILMVSCLALVLAFQSSTKLAAAYGIAVTGTMAITSLLFYGVTRKCWDWPRPLSLLVVAIFLFIDLGFFAANTTKIIYGGWFPLAVGALIFFVMFTWKQGRAYLSGEMLAKATPIPDFIAQIAKRLFRADINIEYAYCTAAKNQDFGCLVIKTQDPEQTLEILEQL